jgi:hypothetical protein
MSNNLSFSNPNSYFVSRKILLPFADMIAYVNSVANILRESGVSNDIRLEELKKLKSISFSPELARVTNIGKIVNNIAKKMISGEIKNGDEIIVDLIDDSIVIYPKK